MSEKKVSLDDSTVLLEPARIMTLSCGCRFVLSKRRSEPVSRGRFCPSDGAMCRSRAEGMVKILKEMREIP